MSDFPWGVFAAQVASACLFHAGPGASSHICGVTDRGEATPGWSLRQMDCVLKPDNPAGKGSLRSQRERVLKGRGREQRVSSAQ